MADEHHNVIKATLQQFQGAYDSAHPAQPDSAVLKGLVNKLGETVYDLHEAEGIAAAAPIGEAGSADPLADPTRNSGAIAGYLRAMRNLPGNSVKIRQKSPKIAGMVRCSPRRFASSTATTTRRGRMICPPTNG
jgi:hypothetical protein